MILNEKTEKELLAEMIRASDKEYKYASMLEKMGIEINYSSYSHNAFFKYFFRQYWAYDCIGNVLCDEKRPAEDRAKELLEILNELREEDKKGNLNHYDDQYVLEFEP